MISSTASTAMSSHGRNRDDQASTPHSVCQAIGEEVAKLLAAGFIKEVFHPKWLANPVLVKKKNGK